MTKLNAKMTLLVGLHDLEVWSSSCFNLPAHCYSTAEKSFIMDFPATLYLDKCEADGGLKVYIKATVNENGQRFASYDTVDFQRPSLIMEVNIWFQCFTEYFKLEELRTMRFKPNYSISESGNNIVNDSFRVGSKKQNLHLDEN